MFDSTIHAKTISRHIRQVDFHSKLWNHTPDDKPVIIANAERLAQDGFTTVALRRGELGGKYVYRHASLPEALLIRHVSESIRRVTNVRQSDRQAIVKSIIRLCSEGVPFRILKMDIKSFYETIDTDSIVTALRGDSAFSRQSIFVLDSFFKALRQQNIPGVPRGIGASATLAEYAMREFDSVVSSSDGVRFYSRYVDDAFAIVRYERDVAGLRTIAERALPSGLELNRQKTKAFAFKPSVRGGAGGLEHCVGFLGYSLKVHKAVSNDGAVSRQVIVDIADKKVSKAKRRIAISLHEYNTGGSFEDLHDRIKILTSNHGYVDQNTGQQRFSGLRYNYGLIDPSTSEALTSLDRFLINTITSTHPNNRLKPSLSKEQRRSLLGYGFRTGFVDNRFFSFTSERLNKIIGCWSHA